MAVKTKRIYEQAEVNDGVRVLVDRVWPRGVSKEAAQLDYWLKEIGPSSELRQWFGHDPDKYETFKQRYNDELQDGKQQEAFQQLKELAQDNDQQLTLLFAAKDETYNQARVLKDLLDKQ
ncbi:DUF488 domain-containing protein [Lentibacillus halophilus]|uniref:DUF488 domain-containing protein n=1 Tax=Lentibacillus halophilus TaxID=295065 RepID=A0ABN0Z6Q8_9BACI